MRTLRRATFDDWIRAIALVAGLIVVGYLAVFGNAQIAPLAAGALISLVGAGVSYLFRGKVVATDSSDSQATIVQKPPPAV